MPLLIDGVGPVAGTLDPGVPLRDRVLAIPNLVGGWFADDAPVGEVSAWAARYGAGTMVSSGIAGRNPTRAQGSAAIVGGAAASLATGNIFTQSGEATVGMRINFTDPAVDLQYLFGFAGGATCAAVYRASGNLIMDSVNDITIPLAAGWHDVVYTQSTTTSTFRIGNVVLSAQNAGIGGPQFVLFSRALGSANSCFRGGISRVLLARAALAEGSVHHASMMALLRA